MQTTQDKVKVQEPEETLGERYLRESNQCRPVTKNFVRIFDNSEERPSVDDIGAGGTSVVSFKVGGKTVVATPEVALSAQCEKLVADLQRQSEDTATTVACFGDQRAFKDVQKTYPRCDCLPYIPPMTSKPLCSVVFCEDRPAPLPSRLLDSGFRSSPSFARLFLQLASSRLAQNLFPRMSWPIQRWVVSKVGRVEALLGMRRYDKAVATEENPLLRLRIQPVLDADECSLIIEDAEKYGAEGGWSTSRHKTHATTDIPIQKLGAASAFWNSTVAPRVQAAIADAYGFRPSDVTPVDVFVVKYSAESGGQRELSVHRDGAIMTFSLLLNSPEDFEGGGTYFEEAGTVYRPEQGVAVFHSGKVRHGGFPITSGVRYVLVGFCLVDHPTLRAELKDWRWGSPSWYLSSSVVSDADILDRIYLPPAATPDTSSDSRIHKGAENPKYRRAALDIEEAASQDSPEQAVTQRIQMEKGLAVRCTFHKPNQDLACVLVSESEDGAQKIVGHVLSKDAGTSDANLGQLLGATFPGMADPDAPKRMVGLVSVAIDPEQRGRKLGQELMRIALGFYAQQNFDFVLLQHRDTGSGRLIEWYKELGFREAYDFIELAMLAPCKAP